VEELFQLVVGLKRYGFCVLCDAGSFVRVNVDEHHTHAIDDLTDFFVLCIETVHALLIRLRLLMMVHGFYLVD